MVSNVVITRFGVEAAPESRTVTRQRDVERLVELASCVPKGPTTVRSKGGDYATHVLLTHMFRLTAALLGSTRDGPALQGDVAGTGGHLHYGNDRSGQYRHAPA